MTASFREREWPAFLAQSRRARCADSVTWESVGLFHASLALCSVGLADVADLI
jgi:hypothetical protein